MSCFAVGLHLRGLILAHLCTFVRTHQQHLTTAINQTQAPWNIGELGDISYLTLSIYYDHEFYGYSNWYNSFNVQKVILQLTCIIDRNILGSCPLVVKGDKTAQRKKHHIHPPPHPTPSHHHFNFNFSKQMIQNLFDLWQIIPCDA